ncbi:MAG: sigma-70 family RNA polymerase sigma factor [Candidatus Hydrogenedentes bacterium]|nr:sigma-70 family RNA polymerase sigma factor [Candidatus Hydrogenedentota bacterium]
MRDESDKNLWKLWAQHRDADAFATIVARHSRMVFATCRRILGNAAEAEDVTQECFLTLSSPEDSVTQDPPARLHALAVYRSLDRLRSIARRAQREATYAAATPRMVELHWNEIEPHVDAAIHELDDETRSLVVQHFLEGKSYSELAELTGIARATVARRVKDGVQSIRDSLRRRGIEASNAALLHGLKVSAVDALSPTLAASLGKIAVAGVETTYITALGASGVLIVSKKIAVIGIGTAVVLTAYFVKSTGSPKAKPDEVSPIMKTSAPAQTTLAKSTPQPTAAPRAVQAPLRQNAAIDGDALSKMLARFQSIPNSDGKKWEGLQPEDLPEDNGLRYFLEAVSLLPDIDGEWLKAMLTDIDLNGWRDDPKLIELIEMCGPAFDALRKGLEVGNAQVPMASGPEELLGYLQYFRQLGQLMTLEAKMYAARGEYNAAFANYSDLLRFSSESTHGAVMIGQLVGFAIQSVSANAMRNSFSNASNDDLEKMASTIQNIMETRPTISETVGTEGQIFSNWFYGQFETPQAFYEYMLDPQHGFANDSNKTELATISPDALYAMMEKTLALYDTASEQAQLPYYEYTRIHDPDMTNGNTVAEMLFPAISNLVGAGSNATAQLDALEIMIALEQYRRAEGAYPGSLDALSPSYLNETRVDPFTGNPYHYHIADDGFRLYSTGSDRVDNGGIAGTTWVTDGNDIVFH